MAKKPASKPTSTATGRQSVILERIEEQLRVVVDGVTMNREALERKIGALDDKLSAKIDALEVAVRQNSADIRQNTADIRQNTVDIQKNSTDIRQAAVDIRKNSADIQNVFEKLDTKVDRTRLASLEQRVETIETSSG